jgi:AmmeMemoRadiSam system protein B
MEIIRQPAVAGSFYPANPEYLQDMVNLYLEEAPLVDNVPKAMIVPHAGYIYSGAIAASAFARLKAGANTIKRVVLVGPSHRLGFKGLAVSHAKFFNTPLGKVPLDMKAIQALLDLPFVKYLDEAHFLEHSLEVQLPFLQTVLHDFSLIPIVTGDASAEQVSEALELFYDDAHTVIVISSDLSHYHDYTTAQRLDKETNDKIESLQYHALERDAACGRVPVCGLLALAQKKSLHIKNIDLRNSGDTAGDKKQVVGYGAYVIN